MRSARRSETARRQANVGSGEHAAGGGFAAAGRVGPAAQAFRLWRTGERSVMIRRSDDADSVPGQSLLPARL